jgi:hypothetical protein
MGPELALEHLSIEELCQKHFDLPIVGEREDYLAIILPAK